MGSWNKTPKIPSQTVYVNQARSELPKPEPRGGNAGSVRGGDDATATRDGIVAAGTKRPLPHTIEGYIKWHVKNSVRQLENFSKRQRQPQLNQSNRIIPKLDKRILKRIRCSPKLLNQLLTPIARV